MNNRSKTLRDSKRLAVTRDYEPCRIENDLLAKVFEVLSHAITPCMDTDHGRSQLQKIDGSGHDQSEVITAKLGQPVERLERAA